MKNRSVAAAFVAASLSPALGACVSPADAPSEPAPVPFAVSEYYSPDGFWGDGEKGAVDGRPAPLTVVRGCANRVPGAAGECYEITYVPDAKRFGGINWQFPHNNWGWTRGLRIAEGASKIVLRARLGKGDAHVKFGAGQRKSDRADFPYGDTFDLSQIDGDLGSDWKEFAVPFRGESYVSPDGVLCAFLIAINAGDSDDPTVVYVDDIRWEK